MSKLFFIAIALTLFITPSICVTEKQITSEVDGSQPVVLADPIEEINAHALEASKSQIILDAGEEPQEVTVQSKQIEQPNVKKSKPVSIFTPQMNSQAISVKPEIKLISDDTPAENQETAGQKTVNNEQEENTEDDKKDGSTFGQYVLWGIALLGIVSIGATVFIVLKK